MALIGAEAAARLAHARPGGRLYVPARQPSPGLTALLGEAGARALVAAAGGEIVELPSAGARAARERRARVSAALAQGLPVGRVAAEQGLSSRAVRGMRKRGGSDG